MVEWLLKNKDRVFTYQTPEVCVADSSTAQNVIKAVGGLSLTIELLGGYMAAPEHSMFPELSVVALAKMSIPERRLRLASQRLDSPNDQKTTLQETISLSIEDLPEAARTSLFHWAPLHPSRKPLTKRLHHVGQHGFSYESIHNRMGCRLVLPQSLCR